MLKKNIIFDFYFQNNRKLKKYYMGEDLTFKVINNILNIHNIPIAENQSAFRQTKNIWF